MSCGDFSRKFPNLFEAEQGVILVVVPMHKNSADFPPRSRSQSTKVTESNYSDLPTTPGIPGR